MHSINDSIEEHFKEIYLYPDYTSSGIWCTCGLGLGNPKEVLNISPNLIDLVEFWNTHWEMASEEHCEISTDYAQKEINNIGYILSSMFREQGIMCTVLTDRTKINRRK